MTVSSANRTALFIDGANLYSTAKALGFDIDYKRLLEEFQSHGTLVRAFYYTAVTEYLEFSAVRPLLAWLDYDGSTVDTKPTEERPPEGQGQHGHRAYSRCDGACRPRRSHRAFLRRRRFPFVGRSPAATRCSSHGRLHDFHPASNDCRRTSPAGGRVH